VVDAKKVDHLLQRGCLYAADRPQWPMSDNLPERSGARFFDEGSRDLGWASAVTKRASMVSTLTVFDVVGAEPALARSLSFLDRSRLRIEGSGGTSYKFRWASGYGNGADVRIQGVLEPA
jgi:hypothetical protein